MKGIPPLFLNRGYNFIFAVLLLPFPHGKLLFSWRKHEDMSSARLSIEMTAPPPPVVFLFFVVSRTEHVD